MGYIVVWDSMDPGGHFLDDYPGTLPLSQATAGHLNTNGYP